jgi:hemolysin D
MAEMARTRLATQWRAHREQIAEQRQQRRNRLARLETTRARIAALDVELPYLAQQVERLERLAARGAVAVSRLDEARRDLAAARQERAVQSRRLAEAEGEVALAERRIASIRAGFRAEQLEALERAREARLRLEQQLVEARSQRDRRTLRAPITGFVQDVAVRVAGTVVEPADVLMRIVPADRPLEVEARILDRDIGFAREGQPVAVKFAAYDFTRYGAVPGRIRRIAPSSTDDREKGRAYTALVELERRTIRVDGEERALRPGMTATVDIDMGQRRIIEYFLGPILRYRDEALRER